MVSSWPARLPLRRSLGDILLEVGQFELELIEHRGTLGGLAMLPALELGYCELRLLDQRRAGADFDFEIVRLLLPRAELSSHQ